MMVLFWIPALALGAAVALLLALALIRRGAVAPAPESPDLPVYREQLAEVERDLARGVLAPEEAERTRLEISRRILEADRAAAGAEAAQIGPANASRVGAVLMSLVLVLGTLGLYLWLGTPGLPDQPLAQRQAIADAEAAQRPTQAEWEAELGAVFVPPVDADPEFLELMAQLRAAVAERPDDLQGHMLLARNEAGLGNYPAAHRTMAQVIALREEVVPQDLAAYLDLLVLATEGYVSPEAEQIARSLIERDPRNGTARYYLGLMHSQTGRFDLAFDIWDRLLRESNPAAPWVPPIEAQIEEVAAFAGEKFRPPQRAPQSAPGTSAPGPSAEDMEAAGDMSPEDRQAMIQNMVEGLAERLATEGGTAEEWARLINALAVLGDRERAEAIWDEAQTVFAEDTSGLEQIRRAANRAGFQ